MVLINEWLADPLGNDAQGEFVELFNDGSRPVGLNGWFLKTKSGSKVKLGGAIAAGEYLVLKRSATKLVLKNSDEKILLYDAEGNLADQSGFLGVATEGKSFSRIGYKLAGPEADRLFVWADPTPGSPNNVSLDAGIIKNSYPYGEALNHASSPAQFIGLLVGSSIVFAAIIFYAVKKHEDLSDLFFARDEEAWL